MNGALSFLYGLCIRFGLQRPIGGLLAEKKSEGLLCEAQGKPDVCKMHLEPWCSEIIKSPLAFSFVLEDSIEGRPLSVSGKSIRGFVALSPEDSLRIMISLLKEEPLLLEKRCLLMSEGKTAHLCREAFLKKLCDKNFENIVSHGTNKSLSFAFATHQNLSFFEGGVPELRLSTQSKNEDCFADTQSKIKRNAQALVSLISARIKDYLPSAAPFLIFEEVPPESSFLSRSNAEDAVGRMGSVISSFLEEKIITEAISRPLPAINSSVIDVSNKNKKRRL